MWIKKPGLAAACARAGVALEVRGLLKRKAEGTCDEHATDLCSTHLAL